ncbi:MAG: SprB repeat-containing protein [Phaeodactylibacter sp.]|nr:SprB repeat-containing protein [Phaeodactylibacter sp.]
MTIILPNIKGLTIVKYLVSLFLICGFQLLQSQPLAFDHTPTAQSGVLIGEVKLDGGIVPEGSWIAAFDSQGNCAGASEVVTFDGATYANLTIFGDDPATTMIDEGLTPNDYFILQLYDLESEQIFVYLENGELSSLFGWTNNNGAPMPGYNDPERVFEFQTSATIFQSVNETVMQPTCFGALDGKVELFVEGLFPPFSFGWNTGADGEALSNLDTGQFFCTITDNWGNNLMVGPFLINAPEPLIIEMNDGLDTCNSDKGLLTPLVYGGTPPFTYVWSTGATTPEIFNLPAGIYQVTVEDANGCDLTAVAGVEPVPEPGISFEINEAKCFGGNDGSISGAITGGITPFSWLWSNGETSNTIVDLIAGIYSVTIQDGLGCVQQELVVVGQPDSISVTFQVTPSSTAEGGYYNGNVFAEVTGGTPPYSYEWDDPNMQLLQIKI